MKAYLLTSWSFAMAAACVAWTGATPFLAFMLAGFAAICLAMAADEWEGC